MGPGRRNLMRRPGPPDVEGLLRSGSEQRGAQPTKTATGLATLPAGS